MTRSPPPRPAPPDAPPAGNRRAVVVCLEEEVFSPVSYLRIIRHLQDLRPWYRVAVFVLPREREAALERIPRAQLLILARSRLEASEEAARRAAAAGVPILCDVDDYVWEFPDYSKVERPARVHTDGILARAACIATPSERLAGRIRARHPDRTVRILPNAGNIWSGAAPGLTPCVLANSDFFRIPERKEEFFRAVRDAARDAGRPLLLYYFSNDPPEHCTDDPHLRVAWMGFRSYSSYRQLLDQLRPEFGFVPLRDEEFSHHKSVVKFAEFAFCGTLGIYSRVEPYAGFIEEGVTGFLAGNTGADWRAATARALRMGPGLRDRMRARVLDAAREAFDYGRIHEGFRALLDEYAAAAPPSPEDGFPENVPELEPFAFREAYAYAAWVMHGKDRDPDPPPPREARPRGGRVARRVRALIRGALRPGNGP